MAEQISQGDSLYTSLPDLAVQLSRDGTVLGFLGGRSVPALVPGADCVGQNTDSIWPPAVATAVARLLRHAIASRTPQDKEFAHDGVRYDARVTAQGPQRAVCVIRPVTTEPIEETSLAQDNPRAHLDRRGFLRRFKESIAIASLNERPLALAIIHLDGLLDIRKLIDGSVFDQITGIALQRLPAREEGQTDAEPSWYIGQLGESLLIAVIETADREAIEGCVSRICQSLREPISVRDTVFQLTPSAGVAILGRDATTPKALVDHAKATAMEARRAGSSRIFFFSDTLRLRSLARLDIAKELREAIANHDIRLRYANRHDLATGALTAHVGYLKWQHALRGDVRPAEFVGVAETTGLSTALSRSLLQVLREDFAAFRSQTGAQVRISYGALRHHVLQESFVSDVTDWLKADGIPPERLELRIAERAYIARDASVWRTLTDMGVQLIVDEFGRIVSSLELLARAPVSGLQLDRAWVTSLATDPVALKVCTAIVHVALALGVTPIATGVDDEACRELLLELGCTQGSGDLYGTPCERPQLLLQRIAPRRSGRFNATVM